MHEPARVAMMMMIWEIFACVMCLQQTIYMCYYQQETRTPLLMPNNSSRTRLRKEMYRIDSLSFFLFFLDCTLEEVLCAGGVRSTNHLLVQANRGGGHGRYERRQVFWDLNVMALY